jgi:hypothetical protein
MPDRSQRYRVLTVGHHATGEHSTSAYSWDRLLLLFTVLQGHYPLPLIVAPEDDDQPCAIWCPRCGMISWHPEDVAQVYCVVCNRFFSNGAPLVP